MYIPFLISTRLHNKLDYVRLSRNLYIDYVHLSRNLHVHYVRLSRNLYIHYVRLRPTHTTRCICTYCKLYFYPTCKLQLLKLHNWGCTGTLRGTWQGGTQTQKGRLQLQRLHVVAIPHMILDLSKEQGWYEWTIENSLFHAREPPQKARTTQCVKVNGCALSEFVFIENHRRC